MDRLAHVDIDGIDVLLWHRVTGGAEGYEMIGDTSHREEVLESLVYAGAVPLTAEAWDAYRITNGMPAMDREFGLFNNPLEARLTGAISDDKGCYTGQEVIARLQTYRKVQRQLMGVELSDAANPGDKLTADGKNVGELTSVTDKLDGKVYGLALVTSAHATDGTTLTTPDGVTAVLHHPPYALLTEPSA
jgi:folate-binding protein YgfZ